MASVDDPPDHTGRLVSVSRINGTSVYNTAGEKLGHVHDVLIDKVSGNAEYAIMSFGGFLHIGDHHHALPWKILTYDDDRRCYVVDIDRAQLEGAPSHAAGDTMAWGDATWGRRIDDYYGVSGYGEPDASGRRRMV
ncbi:MAG: PRC-barrel domain-containing protein [Acetobacteraceae bacterium]